MENDNPASVVPSQPRLQTQTITSKPDAEGRVLGQDQAAALASVAVSGRVVDVLVGPAGAGKTTAMNALRRAWEASHGAGSVVGLAPSVVAAQVLADDLGIAIENTAKWWTTHQHTGATFDARLLVIIDEASLAGTLLGTGSRRERRRWGRRCCWSVTTPSSSPSTPVVRSAC